MSYVVSARKYRPQTFEDVVGQEHITSTLKNALISDKLAHAFLFCGPRGVGKTTCARLLAKVINMPDPKGSLEDGSYAHTDIDISMNIVELDAASNNSVEHIRTLIEQVRFQPQKGKYKVFIIDEVHMLSSAAFNAFLKTLEEPPPYAIFILATTEKHKILPTIMSRCQLYDFRRIQVNDIIEQLEKIAAEEDIKTDHDALYTIAERADGAMRDALSIFDRIASAADGTISYKAVVDNLNLLDFEYFFTAVDHIVREDATGLLLLFDKVLTNGFEGDTFINGLSQHLRNLLYCKQEPTLQLLQMSPALKQRYQKQADIVAYSTLLTALSLLNESDINYPKAKDKRLHIEIALLRACFMSRQIETLDQHSEKKNAELKQAPAMNEIQGSRAIREESPHQESDRRKVDKSKSQISNKDGGQPQSETVTDSTQPKTKLKFKSKLQNTPAISSIDELISAAEEELAGKKSEVKPLSQSEVEELWEKYVSSIESATSKGIIENVLLEVNDEKIIVYVPSGVSREEIQQETKLYSEIRDYFNQKDLVIEVIVDREKFPDVAETSVRKLYSAKEKYEHLRSLNPLLDDFVEALKLKPEE